MKRTFNLLILNKNLNLFPYCLDNRYSTRIILLHTESAYPPNNLIVKTFMKFSFTTRNRI